MFVGINEKDMEKRFSKLLNEINSSPAKKAAFQKNPLKVLTSAGIPLVLNFPTAVTVGAPAPAPGAVKKSKLTKNAKGVTAAGNISVTTHWWGIKIVTDEQFTTDIVDGITDAKKIAAALAGPLAAAAGVSAAVAGPIAAAVALVFVIKIAQIKLTDWNHTGVYWPLTWLQIFMLAASLPLGPTGLAGSAAVFVHPIPN
ncbi:MAG: hypothetical protein HYR56_24360 [Acidobacteria bacterium]|nr:hypothetical protein [Acidobacteriota bacterium]MBI3424068.1 hypothetical protein [Acidobacteriota bacterium]